MDYLVLADAQPVEGDGRSGSLLNFARMQQRCRYSEVAITPVAQRKDQSESRSLAEGESWEALNETWAVFVGWAVWSQLEVERNGRGSILTHRQQMDRWGRRLELAFENGEFRGYYAPQDPEERRTTQKRILAKQSQLSWKEAGELIRQVLGFPDQFVSAMGTRPGLSRAVGREAGCDAGLQ
jgi:hypothetical protein